MSRLDRLSHRFETDPVVVSARGSRVRERRGREFIDYLLGNCCSVLGHSHPAVAEAVALQASRGINVGDFRFDRAEELAARIAAISGKDAVRMVSTGSEAVHLAIRLARAATCRHEILKFEGHYHGWFDEVVNSFTPAPQSVLGIPKLEPQCIHILEWNDLEEAEALLKERGEQLACIILEPVLAHAGTVPPVPGFLEQLSRHCREHGIVVIFDECLTGFRIALGGAQKRLGISADLVVYSKAISGGLPMGVVAGSRRIMDLLSGSVYQAATYDANCLSVVAALAVLDTMETEQSLTKIDRNGDLLRLELSRCLEAAGVPHLVQGFGALFQIFYTEQTRISSFRDAMATDLTLHRDIARELYKRGVYICPGHFPADHGRWWLSDWFVSAAHSESDIELTLSAFREALDEALSA